MNKLIIATLLLTVLLIAGCGSDETFGGEISTPKIVKTDLERGLTALTACEDGVICYRAGNMRIDGGLSCFKDEELISKYCSD